MKHALRFLTCLGLWLAVVLFASCPLYGQGVITTVAGTPWIFRGDGKPALDAPLDAIQGIAVDFAGDVYAGDSHNFILVKISASGILTVVAGNGIPGYSGDGGPARQSSLGGPVNISLDGAGNIYFADAVMNQIRKVSASGTITTVLGYNTGDCRPPANAVRGQVWGLAIDSAGSLYFTDVRWGTDARVLKLTPGCVVTTIAGNGSSGFSGDGGPALDASLNGASGLAVDAAGNLYIADSFNNRVRRISAGGTITTIAGGGTAIPGDGGPAAAAQLFWPQALTFDASGNLYIAERGRGKIRKVSPSGVITTVAGTGAMGYSGDGGPATAASLSYPEGIAVDPAGNFYVADTLNRRVRKVSAGGIISTIAGNTAFKFAGDGSPATSASLNRPLDVAVGPGGSLYVADMMSNRIRKIDSSGIITTVAGSGSFVFSGDGGPATSAGIGVPHAVAADAAGNVFVADTNNNYIRRITPDGKISSLPRGDGSTATPYIVKPEDVAVDSRGNVFVADAGNHMVRKIGADGQLTTVAGSGPINNFYGGGFSGDGGPATSARLNLPTGVIVDAAGNVFIADYRNHRVRKVNTSGTITTVAGNGVAAFAGDGGPATAASLNQPAGVELDAAGNLYIVDAGNARVRLVNSAGVITTVAGGGTLSTDGVKADAALLPLMYCVDCHAGIALDSAGNLVMALPNLDQIKKMLAAPPAFSASPSKLSFSLAAGTTSDPQRITLVAGGTLGVSWSAQATTQSGGSWLSLSPASGTAPGTLAVTASAAGLAPGTYQATITIQAPVAVPSSLSVAVDLTVTAALPAHLAVQPGSLTFHDRVEYADTPAQTLQISNSGGGTLSWTARAEAANAGTWLSVSPTSGSSTAGSPSSVQVSVNLTGLANETYYFGTIVVSSSAQAIRVGIVLSTFSSPGSAPPGETILVSQTGLRFTGVQGGGAVPSQSIGIVNTGQGAMNWTVEAATLSGGNWLSVTPTAGSSDASSTEVPLVEVAVNTSGLSAGQYSGMLRVRAAGADNSPRVVSVELYVLPVGSNPGVEVRPTGLIFATRAGTSSPGSQTVRLATAAPGSLEARGGLMTLDGGDWLQALPRNLVVSASDTRTITVQPTLGSLAAGVYRGVITLLFGDGSVQNVSILFLVVTSSTAAAAVNPFGDESAAAAGCTPAKLLAVHRSLGAGFAALTASPKLIEVQVADDCGTNVSHATALASFSNGDPPLVLTALPNGLYVGTWRPVNVTANVTVTARATLPPLQAVEVQAQGQVSAGSSVPQLFAGGIVNAASYAAGGALAPGTIISAFGRSMATGWNISQTLPLATLLGGATLNIGGIDAPLFFSTDGQINAQLPFELGSYSRPQAYLRVRLQTGGPEMLSVPETLTIGPAQPGIFAMNQAGTGQGAILSTNWKLVDASNPAKAGEWVVVFATGLGLVDPSVPTGQAAPSDRLCSTVVPVQVIIGGQSANVYFAGLAPSFVGLYQVNVQIPSGITPGDAVPLILTQAGIASNTVTLAVH